MSVVAVQLYSYLPSCTGLSLLSDTHGTWQISHDLDLLASRSSCKSVDTVVSGSCERLCAIRRRRHAGGSHEDFAPKLMAATKFRALDDQDAFRRVGQSFSV